MRHRALCKPCWGAWDSPPIPDWRPSGRGAKSRPPTKKIHLRNNIPTPLRKQEQDEKIKQDLVSETSTKKKKKNHGKTSPRQELLQFISIPCRLPPSFPSLVVPQSLPPSTIPINQLFFMSRDYRCVPARRTWISSPVASPPLLLNVEFSWLWVFYGDFAIACPQPQHCQSATLTASPQHCLSEQPQHCLSATLTLPVRPPAVCKLCRPLNTVKLPRTLTPPKKKP